MAAANTLPFPETCTSPNPAPEQITNAATVPWSSTVLDLLAQGASITAAMRHVGYSVSAFHKTCKRHPEFRLEANRTRNTYRAKVAEDFHESEAYARMLVDAVQRDEQLPASLRLRAALAILNRKPDRWLPSPIHTPEGPVDTMDTMDTLDALAELAYRQLLAKFPDEEDFSQPDPPNLAGQATHRLPPRDSMDTVDSVDNTDKVDTVDAVDTEDITDTLDTRNITAIIDSVDTLDTVDTMDTVDTLSTGNVVRTTPRTPGTRRAVIARLAPDGAQQPDARNPIQSRAQSRTLPLLPHAA